VVIGLDVVVVVFPVPCPGVVGRVNVDAVDFAAVGEEQGLEGMIVLGIDDRVKGLVAAALDLAGGDEARIDRVAELRDNNDIVDLGSVGLVTVERLQRCRHRAVVGGDA